MATAAPLSSLQPWQWKIHPFVLINPLKFLSWGNHVWKVEAEAYGLVVSKRVPAFKELIFFAGTTANALYYSHSISLVPLGPYANLVRGISLGSTLTLQAIQGKDAIKGIAIEKKEMGKASTSKSSKKHEEKLIPLFLQLIASVTVVAWAILGFVAIKRGKEFNAYAMRLLETMGGLFVLSARISDIMLKLQPGRQVPQEVYISIASGSSDQYAKQLNQVVTRILPYARILARKIEG